MRAAVVGHVEWMDFIRVERLPRAGDIVHGSGSWQVPAGGGAVAAVQLARLAGGATFFTAVGGDALGQVAREELEALGLTVRAVVRPQPQRRGVTLVDASGERTITVIGTRVAPLAGDPLPWQELEGADGVYVTAGDVGAIRYARAARVLVATARILPVLREAGVELDALVGSARDPMEAYAPGDLDPPPRLVVQTDGERGGAFFDGHASRHVPGALRAGTRWEAVPLPGALSDTYGCGDSFAGGLTYALAAGMPPDRAVAFAATCGAAVATGRGPYERQLRGPVEVP
ncbi:MAG: PfkB family carbohydrate kinase [Actinomycetota bacterium]